MADRIDTVEARSKLKPRRSPYWHKVSTGCHIGFRKTGAGTLGTWLAQSYDPATQRQTRRSLGSFDTMPEGRRFDAAKAEADSWFHHLSLGGSTQAVTVKKACEDYVAHVRETKDATKANEVEGRFRRWVYGEKIAGVALPKLTRTVVDAWRKKLAKTPVLVNPHAEAPKTRERSASSLNRDMTALRAALNHAHDNAHVISDIAWRVALRPVESADGRRDVYLDREQRRALIEKASPDVATLLGALCIVPLRPGALAALSVASFDDRLGVMTVGKDKAGRDRKIKLPAATSAFFSEQAKDKSPTAPLLSRRDGKRWDKDAWKKPVKEAAAAAELPDETTAYALRHSVITDLVTMGLDLLTVAQLSGTSVAMIEKHYGHMRADHAAEALAGLTL